ncbi:MAG TPA: hypothetical protein VEI07_06945 [Planctomycetaceae bacterium]|nr:hypothetical protein [Planctomycetaceae bacterium]
MSDEQDAPDEQTDQDGLVDELLRRVRRSQSRRLARLYADILTKGARKKSREDEDREWQLAAKEQERREPGWGTVLKRGTLFGLPLLVGPMIVVQVGHWLLPHVLHRLNPEGVAELVVAGILLSPVAFLIGMMTAK